MTENFRAQRFENGLSISRGVVRLGNESWPIASIKSVSVQAKPVFMPVLFFGILFFVFTKVAVETMLVDGFASAVPYYVGALFLAVMVQRAWKNLGVQDVFIRSGLVRRCILTSDDSSEVSRVRKAIEEATRGA